MITITGMWLNKSEKGETYMSGYFGNARIFIFKNPKTDNDNAPEYRLVVGEGPKKDKEEKHENTDKQKDDVPF